MGEKKALNHSHLNELKLLMDSLAVIMEAETFFFILLLIFKWFSTHLRICISFPQCCEIPRQYNSLWISHFCDIVKFVMVT